MGRGGERFAAYFYAIYVPAFQFFFFLFFLEVLRILLLTTPLASLCRNRIGASLASGKM